MRYVIDNEFNNINFLKVDKIEFNSSTHRVVIYKSKPVVLPLMTYWKLSDLKADDTVVIQQVSDDANHYQRVKVSELSEVK